MADALAAQKCTLGRSCKTDSMASKHPGRHEKFKVSFVPISIVQLGQQRAILDPRGSHEAEVGRGSLLRSVMDEFLRCDPDSFLKEGLEDEMRLSSEVGASRPRGPSRTHIALQRLT